MDVPRYRSSGNNGRVILLGDGTEVLTDSTDDNDLFDQDKKIEDQIRDGTTTKDSDQSHGNTDQREKAELDNVSQGPTTTIKGVQDRE